MSAIDNVEMKLRLGQPVNSTDGLFGELGDIVVDPVARKVTHIVVEPSGQHSQARLVPIWLVSVSPQDDDVLKVALASSFVRQLQRVAFADFVPADSDVAIDTSWDVGGQELIASPYWDADGVAVDHQEPGVRIPKGSCEIRRRSEVTTADFHVVGHVEGLVADGDDLIAVVVVTSRLGRRGHVVVPMSSVTNVFNDEILLGFDRRDFAALPHSPGLALSEPNAVHGWDSIRAGTSRFARRALHRRHRKDSDSQL